MFVFFLIDSYTSIKKILLQISPCFSFLKCGIIWAFWLRLPYIFLFLMLCFVLLSHVLPFDQGLGLYVPRFTVAFLDFD